MKSTRQTWCGVPVLYRCYDADGRLIYIGSTSSMWDRLTQHRYDSWWVPLLAKLRMQVLPTLDEARAAEKVAIGQEIPAFNVRFARLDWQDMYDRLSPPDLAQYRRWIARERDSSWDLPGWQGRRLTAVAAVSQ